MNTIFADAALYYASRGWRVFPIASGKKAPPLTAHGCHDATDDPAIIRRWWTEHPNANVAIACGLDSDILVLDVDVKNGKAGLRTLEELEQRFGLLETLTQKTPSGGQHLIFKHPATPIKNGVDVLDGIDVR